jgi:ferredoxin-NADP reductase
MSAQTVAVPIVEKTVCGDLARVRLGRPDGYSFNAGQWFRLTLDTARGRQTKTFSFASAPGDRLLEMATRLSGSAFKTALDTVPQGSHVEISRPGGRFALPEGPAVAFLIGGVGITPIRSMLRDAEQRGHRFSDAVLLFGNKEPECLPYGEELEALKPIGVDAVLSFEEAPADWDGERGFIDAAMVRRHVDPVEGRPFVTAGPPAMVAAMEAVLDDLSVPPELRSVERFGAAGPRPGREVARPG